MIIRNDIIPFRGYKAIALWPFIFVRDQVPFDEVDENHERIHLRQQIELLVLFFYLLYLVFWIYNLFKYRDGKTAYRMIPFEREAYSHEDDPMYLSERKLWAWARMKSEK